MASFRPVNAGKKPFFMAFESVEMAGENKAACANAISLAGVLVCLLIDGIAWRLVDGGS